MDDEVGGLAGRAEDALTLAGLVAGASVVVFFTLVIFHGFEPDQWHLAVQFGLNTHKNENVRVNAENLPGVGHQ